MWFRKKKRVLGQEIINLKKRWPSAHTEGSEPFAFLQSIGVSSKSIVESKRLDIRDSGAGYEYTVKKPNGEHHVFFISFQKDLPKSDEVSGEFSQ